MSQLQDQPSAPLGAAAGDETPLRLIRLAREGIPFIAVSAAVTIGCFALGWTIAGWAFFGGTAFVVAFFRDPDRRLPGDPDVLVAPADGTVTTVEEGPDGFRVSIFLSVFDVHVNRAPCSGEVRQVKYRPGRFIAANFDKSSEENERNTLVIETNRGPVSVVQIAGVIARRIVCRVQSGDALEAGERFGMIRFGSRTDLVVPAGAEPLVRIGAKVRGGATPLARWRTGAGEGG